MGMRRSRNSLVHKGGRGCQPGVFARHAQAGSLCHGDAHQVARFALGAGLSCPALNGGQRFTFTEAVSFIVNCKTQEELDRMWEKLSEAGGVSLYGNEEFAYRTAPKHAYCNITSL